MLQLDEIDPETMRAWLASGAVTLTETGEENAFFAKLEGIPCPHCDEVWPLADDPEGIGATVGVPICDPCRDALPLDAD